MKIEGGNVDISSSRIHHHQNRGLWINNGTLEVSSSDIHHNADGIYAAGGTVNVTASDIHENTSGVYVAAGTVSLDECAIRLSTSYGINSPNTVDVDAYHIFWNRDTGPTHSSNPNGTGELISDDVNYSPWHHNQYWWAVRNGRLLWHYSDTTYSDDLAAATFNWNSTTNSMGIVPISSTSSALNANVLISDSTTTTNLLGQTHCFPGSYGLQDTITFFTNNITDEVNEHYPDGWKWQRAVMLHEMGHVLGLGHTDPNGEYTDVMYSGDNGTIDFGDEEKNDYNFLWGTMTWVSPDPIWWK